MKYDDILGIKRLYVQHMQQAEDGSLFEHENIVAFSIGNLSHCGIEGFVEVVVYFESMNFTVAITNIGVPKDEEEIYTVLNEKNEKNMCGKYYVTEGGEVWFQSVSWLADMLNIDVINDVIKRLLVEYGENYDELKELTTPCDDDLGERCIRHFETREKKQLQEMKALLKDGYKNKTLKELTKLHWELDAFPVHLLADEREEIEELIEELEDADGDRDEDNVDGWDEDDEDGVDGWDEDDEDGVDGWNEDDEDDVDADDNDDAIEDMCDDLEEEEEEQPSLEKTVIAKKSTNSTGEITIYGQKYKLTEGIKNYAKIRKEFEILSEQYTKLYEKKMKASGDADTLIESAYKDAEKFFDKAIELILDRLASYEIYTVTKKEITNLVEECGVLNHFEKEYSAIENIYYEINQNAEEAKRQRELRKESRGRFVGGGFGFKGAMKGIIQAELLNQARRDA